MKKLLTLLIIVTLTHCSCSQKETDITDSTQIPASSDREITAETTDDITIEAEESPKSPPQAESDGDTERVTIYSADDFAAFTSDDGTLSEQASIMRAIVTADGEELESLFGIIKGTLAKWSTLDISLGSVTSEKSGDGIFREFTAKISITQSGLERLSVGEYEVTVGDGYYIPLLRFVRTDKADTPVSNNAAVQFVTSFAYMDGGSFGHGMASDTEAHIANIKQLYFASCGSRLEGSTEYYDGNYEEFLDFALSTFKIDASEAVTKEDIEKQSVRYGADGPAIFDVTAYEKTDGKHFVTVSYYADPMKTVAARRFLYTLTDTADGFCLESAECVYDSGLVPLFENYMYDYSYQQLLTNQDDSSPTLPDRDFTELDGDLSFYRFDNGNAAVVWNDKNVWVFDFELERVTPVFDHASALADSDYREEGAKYFDDFTLSLEFFENADYELRIIYNVTSKTADASYTAYSYYTLNSPSGTPRGDVRGYYKQSITYPGYDTPITVKDVNDISLLLGDENNYLLKFAVSLCTADREGMAEAIGIQSGALLGWETVKIADYAISRSDFSRDEDITSLEVYLNISESGLDNLSAGRYNVSVNEGATYPDIVFENLDTPEADGTLVEPVIEWLLPWLEHHGIGCFYNENPYHSQDKVHSFIDYYLSLCRIYDKTPTLEDFHNFMDNTFGSNSFRGYVTRDMVENHGGHGFTHASCNIISIEKTDSTYRITAEYYSDPMNTVVAWRVEYVLTELDEGYRIVSAIQTYDSGVSIMTYGT